MLRLVTEAVSRLPGRVLHSGISGSHLYGVANDASDVDWKFVYCLSRNDLLGLSPPTEKKMTSEGKIEDGLTKFEWVGHEVGKFCRLLLKGNPTMVEMLFAEIVLDKKETAHNDIWEALVAYRKKFLTKQTVRQYLGYIQGQLHRLENKLSLHTTGGQWNTKWAYHMLRLSWDLFRIIEGKEPTVFHVGKDQELLKSVRRGEIEPEVITETIRMCIMAVEDAKPWDPLPDEGPKDWLNSWLLRVRGSYFGY